MAKCWLCSQERSYINLTIRDCMCESQFDPHKTYKVQLNKLGELEIKEVQLSEIYRDTTDSCTKEGHRDG